MVESIGGLFADSIDKFSSMRALKGRIGKKFEETSYHDLSHLVKEFGTGLILLGVMPSDRVFILSDNRKEWLISDLAILSIGGINVSRGNDTNPAEVDYILNHSKAKAIIVENRRQLEKINSLKKGIPGRDRIIIFEDDGIGKEENIITYKNILARGKKKLTKKVNSFSDRLKGVRKEDLATIVYTSGTTGLPKGVMLTHQNILSNIEATLHTIDIKSNDRFLSILPSWHMFERTVEYVILCRGASIVYTNQRNIKKDMISEKPTYIVGVPRIWEAFYQGILTQFKQNKSVTQKVINILLALGEKYILAKKVICKKELRFMKETAVYIFYKRLKAHIVRIVLKPAYRIGEILIYEKVRHATGGLLKAAISGGGSFPDYLDKFFETMGIEVINGYGLTETSPILTMRTLDHNVRGTVGRSILNTEVKVVDEGGEEVLQGDQGVIWVRGPQVMKGYYKDEEATKKVIKPGGWFDTGDLGRIAISEDLVITGRIKDTIVLSGGENIEPEPIELILKESKYIENIIVVGQDRKYLTALIIPDFLLLSEQLNNRDISYEQIAREPSVYKLMKTEITGRINGAKGFKPFERIVKFSLIEEGWTRENGLLTPTLKLKRNVIAEKYKRLIDTMYDK